MLAAALEGERRGTCCVNKPINKGEKRDVLCDKPINKGEKRDVLCVVCC